MTAGRLACIAGLVLSCAGLAAPPVAAQRVEAALDRHEISVQEEALLTVTVEGSRRAEPRLPPLEEFEVRYRGQSSQIEWVNGKVTRRVVHSWSLRPLRTGELNIGPIEVELDGELYRSEPQVLRVVPARESGQGDLAGLFVRAEVSDRQPFVGEQVVFTWRFYRAVRTGAANLESQDLGPFQVEDLGDVRQYQTVIQGQSYEVSEIRKALFPQAPGPAEIPSWTLSVEVVLRRPRDAFSSPFDDFFGRVQTEPRILRSAPIELDVRPLPPPPPDFSGLIGDFTIDSSLSSTEARVGESLTQKVTIAGTGNAQLIGQPDLGEPSGFKIYEDQPALTLLRDGDRLAGRKTFTRALVPLVPGAISIEGPELVYFDPERGEYARSRPQAVDLEVAPRTGDEELRLTEAVGPTTAKLAVRILGDDVVPVDEAPDALAPGLLASSPADWWLALPPAALALLFVAKRREDRYAADVGLRRRRYARRLAVAGLRGSDDPVERGRVLRAYVGDRTGCEGSALTARECRDVLLANGADRALAEELESVLARAEEAGYGGGIAASLDLDALLGLVDRIEAALRKKR